MYLGSSEFQFSSWAVNKRVFSLLWMDWSSPLDWDFCLLRSVSFLFFFGIVDYLKFLNFFCNYPINSGLSVSGPLQSNWINRDYIRCSGDVGSNCYLVPWHVHEGWFLVNLPLCVGLKDRVGVLEDSLNLIQCQIRDVLGAYSLLPDTCSNPPTVHCCFS